MTDLQSILADDHPLAELLGDQRGLSVDLDADDLTAPLLEHLAGRSRGAAEFEDSLALPGHGDDPTVGVVLRSRVDLRVVHRCVVAGLVARARESCAITRGRAIVVEVGRGHVTLHVTASS